MLVRVLEGTLRAKQKILLFSNQKTLRGAGASASLAPSASRVTQLIAGEVGFVVANVKEIHDAKVGDTRDRGGAPHAPTPFPGFKEVKPMVFCGIFPVDAGGLRAAHGRAGEAAAQRLGLHLRARDLHGAGLWLSLRLPRPAAHGDCPGAAGARVQPQPDHHRPVAWSTRSSPHQGEALLVDNPAKLPPVQNIEHLEEPLLTCHIHVPDEYLGAVLKLCQDRRGVQKDIKYLGSSGSGSRSPTSMPLAEVVFDFFDKLKSVSRGYASLDYELAGYQEADLVKLDILLNGEPVDALSVIVHRERAYQRGRELCARS